MYHTVLLHVDLEIYILYSTVQSTAVHRTVHLHVFAVPYSTGSTDVRDSESGEQIVPVEMMWFMYSI